MNRANLTIFQRFFMVLVLVCAGNAGATLRCKHASRALGIRIPILLPAAGNRTAIDLAETAQAAERLGYDISPAYAEPTPERQYAALLKAMKDELDRRGITPESFVRSLPTGPYQKVKDLIDLTFEQARKLGRTVQWHDDPTKRDFYEPNSNTINILPVFVLWGEEGHFLVFLATEHESNHFPVIPKFRLGQTFDEYVRENYMTYALDETRAVLSDVSLSAKLSERGFQYSIVPYAEYLGFVGDLKGASHLGDFGQAVTAVHIISNSVDSTTLTTYRDTWMRNLRYMWQQQGIRAEVDAINSYLQLTNWSTQERATRIRQIVQASGQPDVLRQSYQSLNSEITRLGFDGAARLYRCERSHLDEVRRVIPIVFPE